jgi:hypothetical protein
MLAARPTDAAPAASAPTWRRGLIREERLQLLIQLRRYFAWADGGRRADPWASGVARAQRYDAPRVVTSKPGSAGPGRAAEAEGADDAWLRDMDALITALPVHERALLRWKALPAGERPSTEDIAERWGCGPKAVQAVWRALSTRLVNHLWPGGSVGWSHTRPIPTLDAGPARSR